MATDPAMSIPGHFGAEARPALIAAAFDSDEKADLALTAAECGLAGEPAMSSPDHFEAEARPALIAAAFGVHTLSGPVQIWGELETLAVPAGVDGTVAGLASSSS